MRQRTRWLRKAHAHRDLFERRNPAAAALYIVPGGSGDSLFSTHPDTANRIAALEQIAVGMGLSQSPRPGARASVPGSRVTRPGSALDPLGQRR